MKIDTNLETNKSLIDGLCVIIPDEFEDERGFFYESWNHNKFNTIINRDINFLQDNHSCSKKGVIRGLHYQLKPNEQEKLIRCIKGSIFDVAVDIRKNSKSFGKWFGLELNEQNKKQLWIPSGFAHGFITISSEAEIIYKTTKYWNKESERSIIWNDKELAINWQPGKSKIKKLIINKKDSKAQTLNEAINKGEIL